MPTADRQDPPASALPPTCEVREWQVFTDGYHKPGEFFSPADVRQIADNFAALTGQLIPTAKLGHDTEQRTAESWGLPNVGKIVGCRADDAGNMWLHVFDVPTHIGGLINATADPDRELGGRYNSGSVELKRDVADPRDPAKTLPGSVLTAIAFLGEEEPAVKGCKPPVAVFADGTRVPPNFDPLPVPADVNTPAAEPTDSRLSAAVLCFSQGASVMPRDEINQKLIAAGLDPAAVAAMSDEEANAAVGFTAKYGAGIGKKSAADNPPPPPEKKPDVALSDADKAAGDDAQFAAKFSGLFSKGFADATAPLVQRMGAMEASVGEAQKAAQASMSTMSAVDKNHQTGRLKRVQDAVQAAWLARKLDPSGKKRLLDEGTALATTATFAAGDNGALDAWLDSVAKLDVHPFARNTIPDGGDVKPKSPLSGNPIAAAILRPGGVFDNHNKASAKAARDRAAA